ncbi:MAG TPA: hypothetical protein VGG33_10015, partial [Polyangia bacterium]
MNLSDSLKALVLAGSLAGRCPSPEPPPGPTPSDAGVADVLPATPDTAAADTGPMPGDAGASADATAPDGGGTPQPDAEPMPQGPVTSTFEGGVSYLLYPYGGGPECAANQDPVFTVSLRAGESACVPAGYTDMLPFAMTEVQVCTAGAGCAPCDEGDVRCAPQTCFAPLPAPAPGDACTNRLQHRDGEEVTRYVLFRAVD